MARAARRRRFIVGYLCCLILWLKGVELGLQNNLVGISDEYFHVQRQVENQQAANSALEQEILQNQALMVIEQKAKARGFIPVTAYYPLR